MILMWVHCYARSARIRLLLHRRKACKRDGSAERQKLPRCTDLIRNHALHQHEYRMSILNLFCPVERLMKSMLSLRQNRTFQMSGSKQPPAMRMHNMHPLNM